MRICDAVQERLAESGSAIIDENHRLRIHVESCAECKRVLADLERLAAMLEQLPDPDAPQALVERTEAALADSLSTPALTPKTARRRRRWSSGLAAGVVVISTLGLTHHWLSMPAYEHTIESGLAGIGDWFSDAKTSFGAGSIALAPQTDEISTEPGGYDLRPGSAPPTSRAAGAGARANDAADALNMAPSDMPSGGPRPDKEALQQSLSSAVGRSQARSRDAVRPDEPQLQRQLAQLEGAQLEAEEAPAPAIALYSMGPRGKAAPSELNAPPPLMAPAVAGEVAALADSDEAKFERTYRADSGPVPAGRTSQAEPGAFYERDDRVAAPSKTFDQRGAEGMAVLGPSRTERPTKEDAYRKRKRAQPGDKAIANGPGRMAAIRELGKQVKGRSSLGTESGTIPARPQAPGTAGGVAAKDAARHFLAAQESLESVPFTDATGYWSNTYVPGDPAMRVLAARLEARDRAGTWAGTAPERAVRRNWQPFDPPESAALAVYLHADKRAIEGPARLRVQVGLKGAQRQGGHRPAMNVGVVLDLRALSSQATPARARALVTAIQQARQPGDRFSLTVAGQPGGLIVAPEAFRHGALQVAMNRLFDGAQAFEGATLDLPGAVSAATDSVRLGDDPGAILGSSLVLLITASPIGSDLAAMERMAHENAVDGVSLSVVSLEPPTDLDAIDRLVLAGQGNRRVLGSPAEASRLVDRELHAASRAVARAVRLRIRLGPGVKLIDVLGSYRLDAPEAQQVRDAERSIDRRLERNLGIRADRGEDEDGIQIVIPSFYANDTHVVLLDVVTQRPGPVAEVTVRYKDVVYSRNGVARAQLSLMRGNQPPGALELSVFKNVLAQELSQVIRDASRHVSGGEPAQAAMLLAAMRQLLQGLRQEMPGWSIDEDLLNDEAMLAEYLTLLSSRATLAKHRQSLVDSLRYAAFRRLQTSSSNE